MRRFLLLLPAVLFACEGQQATQTASKSTTSSGEQLAASAPPGGGLQQAPGGVQARIYPDVVYPEDVEVEIVRLAELRDAAGLMQQLEERLLSDGLGNTQLTLQGVAAEVGQPLNNPTPAQSDRYLAQQGYYIKYRDLHLGASSALWQNYLVAQGAETVDIAGIACEHYTLAHKHGMGDAELFLDPATRLLMGWTLFDASGVATARMRVQRVNWAPNLGSASWPVPFVSEQDYAGAADDHLLGLPPLRPAYLPQGYYLAEARILFTEVLLPGFGNLLVERYSDGVRQLFLAQHERDLPPGHQPLATITDLRLSDLGGLRIAEGDPTRHRLYVVGDLPLSELHTIFGGMLPE
jgi:hypothetical protein